MVFRFLADLVVFIHLAFVVFVVCGGFLALAWRWVAWIHVPVAIWGAWIEISNWICPLTPLENWLRGRAGDAGYAGGFVEHYVISVLYPDALTRPVQLGLATFVVAVNVVAYWLFFAAARRRATLR